MGLDTIESSTLTTDDDGRINFRGLLNRVFFSSSLLMALCELFAVGNADVGVEWDKRGEDPLRKGMVLQQVPDEMALLVQEYRLDVPKNISASLPHLQHGLLAGLLGRIQEKAVAVETMNGII